MPMKINNLEDLLIEELKDLYNAEKQLIEALPKMAQAAVSPQLKKGFQHHLEQTKKQAARIEKIFANKEYSPRGKKCVGMEGLIKEGEEIINSDIDKSVLDAALIAAAQRVEHYEISAYGTARAYAEMLGDAETVRLLNESIQEEGDTDKKLTMMAEDFANQKALS
ncbi:MAG: ferritin-like domain-containing protein [Anaerolineaceae bacterium]|mgnify:CR=1 FL=1|jgi:ferritin-like metal-binding protein YciE|nr:ferritin-like domain-containing protein [Anaerolineaceae bacterium]